MIMESPVGTQEATKTNGARQESIHALHPLTTSGSAVTHSAFVMASGDHHAQLLMQPPSSIPLMVPPYQMVLPTQGVIDQQGLLQQQVDNSSRSSTPSSEHLAGRDSGRSTPVTLYQQAQGGVPSPVRPGSVGSPLSVTPSSLGSPLPTIMADGTITQHGLQLQGLHASGVPINLTGLKHTKPLYTTTVSLDESVDSEESHLNSVVDISKLKPPRRPLTSYMRFSKTIWPQVKAANSTMTVCEIGSTIGRMWRDLADTEKQKYNEEFANDKIRYDSELAEYLKITGLQASDLIKKPKKKGSSDNSRRSRSHQKAAPAPVIEQVVQQVQTQQVIGVQPVQLGTSINGPAVSIQNTVGAQGIPQQVISSLAGLPGFSQLWQSQQGAAILSQAQAGGQEQLIVQQGPGGHQIVVNTLGIPTGTVVNGSTGAAGENMIGTPILIQPAEGQTALYSTDAEGNVVKAEVAEGTATSQANLTQLAALGWQQVMPGQTGDLQQQQQMINLINMATAQTSLQQDQLSQAAQIAGLQPPGVPLNIQHVVSATNEGAATESQPMESSDSNGAQTLPNGTTTSGAHTQSVVTVAQMPSAHNLYNSYGFNPWSAISGQVVQTAEVVQGDGTTQAADGTTQGIQVVYNRENILETELLHLRSALSEKTKEVQRLTQELEKAYSIIEQLKQQNPTAVIQLPATLANPLATEMPAQPDTPPAIVTTTS